MAFFVVLVVLPVVRGDVQSGPICPSWRDSSVAVVRVLDDEVGWLSCPLFSHLSISNNSSTQGSGHHLIWSRLPEGQVVEQPITYSSHITKDGDRLWLQPATANDTGLYVCTLRNESSCSKTAVRLEVLQPQEAVRGAECELPVATVPNHMVIPLQQGKTLDCPDLQDAARMATGSLTVTWFHRCQRYPFPLSYRQQKGVSLQFHMMMDSFQGSYYCIVHYQRKDKVLRFTRTINVTAVYPITLPKKPTILHPTKEQLYSVKLNTEVRLVCRALFPYLDTPFEIWWTVDGKTVEQLADTRFSKTSRQLKNDYGDQTMESELVIHSFQAADLKREYNCSVKNQEGSDTRRAQLEEEVLLPSVELGCGLGVVLVFLLVLFVLYHVYWLELLLLYRSWFGTDERHTDNKEYDVYISYARNSEDEQFVLSTLQIVLENELGYSVCIFDRDSLPGGTITDETLNFVARSRRLLVVISPGYASQGSQALLELKAGIDDMALGGHLRVILVQYKPVQRKGWVRELRRARVALVLVQWQGDKSRELTSRFWKRLRVELPVQRVGIGGNDGEDGWRNKDLALGRFNSQNSTSSQTGLLTNTVKTPHSTIFSSIT
ncbi:interleukin-1 receptor accessory protein-like [Thalassophryne amazonica]|uniref:interleukin-1 receptor accessory protein-like n=1 Tax=Thalassophryne amazonica TaxID=390379 RepID=UPI001471265E|nr:interleukin-1 receptor accessory protein-like [Thalassophryne amazonica]